MFYRVNGDRHGLAHDPFKAIVSPRPIGWIGSRGRDGSLNLAPYSFFNAVSENPKIIMFSSSGRKDSLRNAEETHVFTASLVSIELASAMNISSRSVDYDVDEFRLAGLTAVMGRVVDAPYVGEALAVLECAVTEIRSPIDLDGMNAGSHMVFGQVVGIHIKDQIICDGRIDMSRMVPVGRLGYKDYAAADDVFSLDRPQGR